MPDQSAPGDGAITGGKAMSTITLTRRGLLKSAAAAASGLGLIIRGSWALHVRPRNARLWRRDGRNQIISSRDELDASDCPPLGLAVAPRVGGLTRLRASSRAPPTRVEKPQA